MADFDDRFGEIFASQLMSRGRTRSHKRDVLRTIQ